MPTKKTKTKKSAKKKVKAAPKKKARVKAKPKSEKKEKTKKKKAAVSKEAKAVKKEIKEVKREAKEIKKKKIKSDNYYKSEGKRKTSVARVRIWTKGEKEFLVNQKPLEKYFPTPELQKIASASLEKMKCVGKFKISVVVKGGGLSSQAEAIRHGIARVLVIFNPDFRKRLKKAGFLRRDARKRERKKFGLKRARRAPQWRKR
jgi:small subunit ribosomal protein S9